MTAHLHKRKTQKLRLLFLGIGMVILFGQPHHAYSQEKPIISVGMGVPEFINIGFRIPRKKIQFGISVGGFIIPEDIAAVSFSGDFRYYFGASSIFVNERPWYWKIGFNYLRNEDIYSINEYVFLNTRLGFEFNLSKKFGTEVDFGGMLKLHHIETKKSQASGWDFEIINFPVLPSFSTSIFYRL